MFRRARLLTAAPPPLSHRRSQAAAKLRAVTELAPLMSEEGGQARLQLAVCLDSLNMADEAKRLYQSLNRHPNIDIQKRANRMLWGMTTAAEFLKADKINYNTGIRVRRISREYPCDGCVAAAAHTLTMGHRRFESLECLRSHPAVGKASASEGGFSERLSHGRASLLF